MSDLAELTRRITDAIPLTRHLGFRLAHHHRGELLLEAPLAPNINDKGTFFAGSQATLLTLGGWALTTLEGESVVARVDVVAAESSVHYIAPLSADATLRVRVDEDDLAAFARRLQRRGRARLSITAELTSPAGEVAARFRAHYLARDLDAQPGAED